MKRLAATVNFTRVLSSARSVSLAPSPRKRPQGPAGAEVVIGARPGNRKGSPQRVPPPDWERLETAPSAATRLELRCSQLLRYIRVLGISMYLACLPWQTWGNFNSGAVGTTTGQFLKLGADARGVAMGQAMSAVAEDATALYWNPAGLAALDKRHASFTHALYFQSVFYDFAAYAQAVKPEMDPPRRRPLKPSGLGTWAVGLLYLNAGELKEIDNTGTPTGGAFTPRDFAFMAAWGTPVTHWLDFGVGLKFIDSRIQASARTGSGDAGLRLRWRFGEWPYVLALNARNIGGNLKFRDHADPLPTSIQLGQSLRPLRYWILASDLVLPRDNKLYPTFGSEVQIPLLKDAEAALRGGWSAQTNSSDLDGLAGISFGMGLRFKGLGWDYAWVPFGVLGHTHRFTLSYQF